MRYFSCFILLLLTACGGDPVTPATTAPAEPPYAIHQMVPWELPATEVAAQPDLVVAPDGRVLMSWIAAAGNGMHALRFAAFDGRQWNAAQDIARGDDWFINWADTPHLAATADGALWAHWLRQNGSAKYAYDVVLSRSGDGGKTWSAATPVNDDGTPTEHGFVSLWPQSVSTLGIAWLDGRNTASAVQAGHEGHDSHAAGAMSLRAARADPAMRKSTEMEVDARTCDCCQTSAALTDRGPLLVYRGRDANEIRDILVTRLEGDTWTSPRKVHDDQWKMPACPVNGPAVIARGAQAWVAWYTEAQETPRLRVAHSTDSGHSFGTPISIDQGPAVQGRVGVAVEGQSIWVSWLREEAGGQSLWLARYPLDLSREIERIQVATLQGRGRATGFPQLVSSGGNVFLAWTDVVNGKPRLQGARATIKSP